MEVSASLRKIEGRAAQPESLKNPKRAGSIIRKYVSITGAKVDAYKSR